jgi:hypothetical protein
MQFTTRNLQARDVTRKGTMCIFATPHATPRSPLVISEEKKSTLENDFIMNFDNNPSPPAITPPTSPQQKEKTPPSPTTPPFEAKIPLY